MPRTVIPFRRRRPPIHVGPVSVTVLDCQVQDGGAEGALLDLSLRLRLAEVPPHQRRELAQLLNGPDPLCLTLSDTPER